MNIDVFFSVFCLLFSRFSILSVTYYPRSTRGFDRFYKLRRFMIYMGSLGNRASFQIEIIQSKCQTFSRKISSDKLMRT